MSPAITNESEDSLGKTEIFVKILIYEDHCIEILPGRFCLCSVLAASYGFQCRIPLSFPPLSQGTSGPVQILAPPKFMLRQDTSRSGMVTVRL